MKLADPTSVPGSNLCSGCAACYAVCPCHAISMKADEEGFLYPVVDISLCSGCQKCQHACPVLCPPQKPSRPLIVYAARSNDNNIRRASSSGGIFSELAQKVLSSNGLVFGASFQSPHWRVCHQAIDSLSDLKKLRGSKYVQSWTGEVFQEAKSALRAGRAVLFSGTPCQIAALKNVLASPPHVPFQNLLLVEVACHAVPSPYAWNSYLNKRLADATSNEKYVNHDSITNISFRDKRFGWKNYSVTFDFTNGKKYVSPFRDDPFMRGFLAELFNRPSCHQCTFRHLKSGADLTLADYWGVHNAHPEIDDDQGSSLILINTTRGESFINAISHNLTLQRSSLKIACKGNPALIKNKKPHPLRDKFFQLLSNEHNFDVLVDHLLKITPARRKPSWFKRALNACLSKTKK